jgi:glycosyltransferase involved in cell wall biosynthesis
MAKSPSSWFSRRFLLGQCDAIIAASHFVAKVLCEGVYEPDSPEPERRARPPLRGDHSKIHVIHGGIDTDRFRPMEASALRAEWGLAPEHFAFAVVGGYQLPRGKGQPEFLQAAARVHQQAPRARFLIVGRGNMEDSLRADIKRLGLSGKAWLTPYCTDMPAAMNAIDCLVHPAVGTEAFGLVLVEAFSCGAPVIASALDGVPEAFAIGNCGRLVPPDNPEALAEAMLGRAQEPSLDRLTRGQLHARVAGRVSLGRAAAEVLDLYRRLAGPSL